MPRRQTLIMATAFKFRFAIDEGDSVECGSSLSKCPGNEGTPACREKSPECSIGTSPMRYNEHGMIGRESMVGVFEFRLGPPRYEEEVVRLGQGLDELTVLERKDQENKIHLEEAAVIEANREDSDIVEGRYEGGLKIWECSLDLARHVHKERSLFKGKRVLELGCGVGLPGIAAVQHGASHVLFQDFNRDVLLSRTIPSVLLNTKKSQGVENLEDFMQMCSFCYGSWDDVRKVCGSSSQHSFDVILSSETIYNCDNYTSLLQAMKHFLVEMDGLVFVAAKAYYFGVGGSVSEFLEFVQKDGYFRVQSVIEHGSDSVHRMIITMTTTNNSHTCVNHK